MRERRATEDAFRAVLDRLAALVPAEAVDWCDAELAHAPADPVLLGLRSLAEYFAQRYEAAAGSAAQARASAAAAPACVASAGDGARPDPLSRMLALAVSGLARSGTVTAADAGVGVGADHLAIACAERGSLDEIAPGIRAVVAHVLTEAALACGRLELAESIVERSDALPESLLPSGDSGSPYLGMMRVTRVRLLAFRGRIAEAVALGEKAAAEAEGPAMRLLAEATLCLAQGNAAERGTVRGLAEKVTRTVGSPDDRVSSGCYLLVAYGLVATADLDAAAHFVLAAGGAGAAEGPGELAGLPVIDRALGFELLVASALAADDVEAAAAWQEQARSIAPDPIARSIVDRLDSRVALARGNAGDALGFAESAIAGAQAEGRMVEAAEGEIVRARAQVALRQRGAAQAGLEALAASARPDGYRAAERSAARELRGIGRRLRPRAGSGWEGLSPREQTVALLLVEGFDNAGIAEQLHVSPHTARAHVSRVLAAFGVASRTAAAARLIGLLAVDTVAPAAPLTPRQRDVARHVALGERNDQIAAELGISVKAVEKHMADIRRRWQVSSRVSIARFAAALGPDVAGPQAAGAESAGPDVAE
ncbi:helix-turn-helix domain-containing protein [Herbiconiux ginsengi]|uniref:Regulatory protein, luxR family n=1 Tax=Herbiconiux ginsengi TaxID=381665 RepID=A0A1H3SPT4_9MICO|nr:helix-turn-helix transcriptional regulator [Herbiconiux ginsengi]SDZ39737.1 regulatory protein, luxR family [Herbiconiux ginsengi]